MGKSVNVKEDGKFYKTARNRNPNSIDNDDFFLLYRSL